MGDHTRDLDAAGKQITYTDLQTDKLAKAPIGWRHTPYLPAMFKTSRVESGGARCNTKSFWVAERETGGARRSLSVWAIRTDRREGMMGPWLIR